MQKDNLSSTNAYHQIKCYCVAAKHEFGLPVFAASFTPYQIGNNSLTVLLQNAPESVPSMMKKLPVSTVQSTATPTWCSRIVTTIKTASRHMIHMHICLEDMAYVNKHVFLMNFSEGVHLRPTIPQQSLTIYDLPRSTAVVEFANLLLFTLRVWVGIGRHTVSDNSAPYFELMQVLDLKLKEGELVQFVEWDNGFQEEYRNEVKVCIHSLWRLFFPEGLPETAMSHFNPEDGKYMKNGEVFVAYELHKTLVAVQAKLEQAPSPPNEDLHDQPMAASTKPKETDGRGNTTTRTPEQKNARANIWGPQADRENVTTDAFIKAKETVYEEEQVKRLAKSKKHRTAKNITSQDQFKLDQIRSDIERYRNSDRLGVRMIPTRMDGRIIVRLADTNKWRTDQIKEKLTELLHENERMALVSTDTKIKSSTTTQKYISGKNTFLQHAYNEVLKRRQEDSQRREGNMEDNGRLKPEYGGITLHANTNVSDADEDSLSDSVSDTE